LPKLLAQMFRHNSRNQKLLKNLLYIRPLS
jgi:hypothetical protein